MNAILAIPEELRLILLMLLGAAIGGQINRGIYSLAFHARRISPWSPPPPAAPPRHWYDRLPVFGWLTVSREEKLHGSGYWIRPLCIEIACALGALELYLWETGSGLVPAVPGLAASPAMLHSIFLAHLILCALMMVATFIDIDEQLIPDGITIPGTLAGLVLAACLPLAALPIPVVTAAGAWELHPLRLVSPNLGLAAGLAAFPVAPWPDWLSAGGGLALGLGCWWAWYVVVVPKTIWMRSGWRKGVGYMLASIRRYRPSRWMSWTVLAGTPAIAGAWYASGPRWQALLSALVGMAFGGGLIWTVRIIGSAALKKEAMGFGDVTLMAMIGAFLGWQACLIAFLLAPFAGLVIALPQRIISGTSHIAFGPFLCMGSLATILAWATIWERSGRFAFGRPWLVPGMLAGGVCLMALLLGAWGALSSRRKQ